MRLTGIDARKNPKPTMNIYLLRMTRFLHNIRQ